MINRKGDIENMKRLYFIFLFFLLAFPSMGRSATAEKAFERNSGSEGILMIPSGLVKPCSGEHQNGIHKQYYATGQVYDETSCVDGKKHGTSKIYTKEGRLWVIRNFNKDKLDGIVRYYDKDGQIAGEEFYVNNALISSTNKNLASPPKTQSETKSLQPTSIQNKKDTFHLGDNVQAIDFKKDF